MTLPATRLVRVNIPEYVGEEFGAFYDTVFERHVRDADGSAVFLEYAWPIAGNTGLRDSCSTLPMSEDELGEKGMTARANDRYEAASGFVTRLSQDTA